MSRDTWFPTMLHLTWLDSDEPVQPLVKLRNSKWCSVSSVRLRIFKRLAKALISLRECAGWSAALLVAHTTLLKISCHDSYIELQLLHFHFAKVTCHCYLFHINWPNDTNLRVHSLNLSRKYYGWKMAHLFNSFNLMLHLINNQTVHTCMYMTLYYPSMHHQYPLLSTVSTHEGPSQHDWKIVESNKY